ncbi:hypothetical protein CANCADRAFT_32997 [Tortispora caseinolytica NRRL Y-17796]|uniref:Nucleolar protein 58 n=1 Tax=Tortispora caseinolytica NRRL Y-17796 TaxID=767744 RepID=A0A1E4T9Q9_9ASCO|nr:hypothetical protein CANCADRAFT_32997 [Tortispora caseinolytica NRRL Y-17796]
MLILTETPAGYALLKAKSKVLKEGSDDLLKASSITSTFKVKAFSKFESAADALEETQAIIEGRVSGKLANMLDGAKDGKDTLVVADPKLGSAISKTVSDGFKVVSDSSTADMYRAIREHLSSLIPGLSDSDMSTMSLGLAHSLGRYKLKFSADKVDTMIIQAIALLDDIDKELNTYAMRIKEWYGWHFPEMTKIVQDSVAYAKVIKTMGVRTNASETDLSEVLPEDIEAALKAAAEISMGTEITDADLENISSLADQIIEFSEYREQLYSYLISRMNAIAPNLSTLMGELVGARLIAHAGSLMSLAKAPASTIQILGAEKALFRALKTKRDTPKYGLVYNSSIIGQASGRNKGKIARVLSAKAAVSIRYDALAEDREEYATIGLESRAKVEARLSQLEGRDIGVAKQTLKEMQKQTGKTSFVDNSTYNTDADAANGDVTMDTTIDGCEAGSVSSKLSKEERKRLKKEAKAARKAAKADRKRKRTDDEDDEEEAEENSKDKEKKSEEKLSSKELKKLKKEEKKRRKSEN